MAKMTGLGSQFQRENGSGTWETIAQVANIQPPQLEREVVEVEELDPPDGVMEKLPGVIDPGEVTLTLNFDPDDTGHTTLESDFYAGTVKNYRIRFPNGKGWTFSAFISGWAPQEVTRGDVVQVEVTFTVTAKPTFGNLT